MFQVTSKAGCQSQKNFNGLIGVGISFSLPFNFLCLEVSFLGFWYETPSCPVSPRVGQRGMTMAMTMMMMMMMMMMNHCGEVFVATNGCRAGRKCTDFKITEW